VERGKRLEGRTVPIIALNREPRPEKDGSASENKELETTRIKVEEEAKDCCVSEETSKKKSIN